MKKCVLILVMVCLVASCGGNDSTPRNEIHYTFADGVPVKLYEDGDEASRYPFGEGVSVVSNVYENGEGVFTCDGDITAIGDYAFAYCRSLTSITIPDSVTSIGDCAFYNCEDLKSITIPNSVTYIGDLAFADCWSLTSINLPNNLTTITDSFARCGSLTSITIPDSVTSIGDCAFYRCESLTAFYGKFASEDNRCLIVDGTLNSFAPAGLTSYTIPDSVTSIGDDAFSGCENLKSITIPDSVTSIGDYAFAGCTKLRNITIPNGVTYIGDLAFSGCENLKSINIPDGVISIGDQAFEDCWSLKSITIPNSVTYIGRHAFSLGTNLAYIYCKAVTPPSLANSINNTTIIYVPQESVWAYKSHKDWGMYADQIIGYNFGE